VRTQVFRAMTCKVETETMIWIFQKLDGFVRKQGSFALQEPFLLLVTYKRKLPTYNYWRSKEGWNISKKGKFYTLKLKGKGLEQFENLQNYKDLYGKPLECEWWEKYFLPTQILLISNVYKKNSIIKDINICM